MDRLAGGTLEKPTKIKSLQDAINAAEYVSAELDSALQYLYNDPDEAKTHIDGGQEEVDKISEGGNDVRKNVVFARNAVAFVAAAGIVYSAVRLFRDRDVYRGIDDPKWWVSFDPKLLGETPSMKLALNVRF